MQQSHAASVDDFELRGRHPRRPAGLVARFHQPATREPVRGAAQAQEDGKMAAAGKPGVAAPVLARVLPCQHFAPSVIKKEWVEKTVRQETGGKPIRAAAGNRIALPPPEKGIRRYFSESLIEVNLVFRLVPRPLTTAMIASEMPAAISPYSMAVAPDSSFQNFKTERFM